MALHGCFVTGTDTGVGKTVVAAAIAARLRRDGITVSALKPVITGLAEAPQAAWSHDHELLARVTGRAPEDVVMASYGPAVSPHLAVEMAGVEAPSLASLCATIRYAGDGDVVLVVEGVGGLLVPLGPDLDVRALARELGLTVVVAARPGLGTINHTLLTLEAARSAGLEVAGVVLTPWPEAPDQIQRSNRETITRIGAIEVATLGFVSEPRSQALAAAADALPLRRWLSLPEG